MWKTNGRALSADAIFGSERHMRARGAHLVKKFTNLFAFNAVEHTVCGKRWLSLMRDSLRCAILCSPVEYV